MSQRINQTNDNRRGEAGRKQREILLVEDDEEIRELMGVVLRSEGFSVVELADGMEALSYLGGAEVFVDDVSRPDLIVADILMPNFSGLDLLMGLKEQEVTPPVLVVTGVRDAEVRDEARRLGAAEVLGKPFDVETFVGAVDGLVDEMEAVGRSTTKTEETADETPVPDLDLDR